MKKIKQTIGVFSILAWVVWVFSNENSVGAGGRTDWFCFNLFQNKATFVPKYSVTSQKVL